jgi:hypothetical protein
MASGEYGHEIVSDEPVNFLKPGQTTRQSIFENDHRKSHLLSIQPRQLPAGRNG